MNFNKYIFHSVVAVLLCILPCSIIKAQPEKTHRILLLTGGQHITLLDEQATPVLYRALGPELTLVYERQTFNHLWQLELNGGMFRFRPDNPELRFYKPSLTGISGGLNFTYLYFVKKHGKSILMTGGIIKEEILVDFEGIGNWPWAFGQGGIYATGRYDYQITQQHLVSACIAFPILPWITDMPYNQIPRVEGRAPDVISLFRVGTRIPFWHNYQRVNIRLTYEYNFHNKWNLRAMYDWAWFHDSVPRDLWSYQGKFNVGIIRKW